tara:strand:- start:1452 stop:2204 length:753 start_codon:yes stop_codon:yes gene_type:complete
MTNKINYEENVKLIKYDKEAALDIVNAARVSFGMRNDKEFKNKDRHLIEYLWISDHTSPFRHMHFTFYIRAPIFVLNQWMKHQVGCAWNQKSGRYIKFDSNFYTPEAFRSIPDKSIKQGSGEDLNCEDQSKALSIYRSALNFSYAHYNELLEAGVCREQARSVLPLALMSECYWTCSLHALINFLRLRLASDAQKEIQLYARDVLNHVNSIDSDLSEILQIILDYENFKIHNSKEFLNERRKARSLDETL